MSNRCIHDYLSFTWSPLPLIRLTGLAKLGAQLKAVPNLKFFSRWCQYGELSSAIRTADYRSGIQSGRLPTMSEADYRAYQAELRDKMALIWEQATDKTRFDVGRELNSIFCDMLNSDEFVTGNLDFNSSYADMIGMYGVQLLDLVCHSEIDCLIYSLNAHLSGHASMNDMGPFYGRWSYRARVGGMFGYSHSADLLCDDTPVGLCCWGSMNHGCMVSFSGQGCAALDFTQLHHVTKRLPGFKITRCDVALDDYTGSAFDVDRAKVWAEEGRFTKRRPPSYCYIESGTLSADMVRAFGRKYGLDPNKGKTFYVGSRESGLMVRFYEKGKQLSSSDHPNWQRAEVEFRSVDRVIDPDILINPDKYFVGAYPCLSELVEAVPVSIPTTKGKYFSQELQAWVAKGFAARERVVKTAAIQCGRVVNYLSSVEQKSPSQIIDLLTGHLPDDSFPIRLRQPSPQILIDHGHEIMAAI